MKTLKSILGFIILLTVTSCVTTTPLNQQFYNSKKVGIVLQVDSIGMAKAGGQGLLDMALTSGNRFTEPLKAVEPNFNLDQRIKSEITNILTAKNKQFEFLDPKLDFQSLKKFAKPDSDKKYCKTDLRPLKDSNIIDEILVVKVRYGLLVSYYGLIELDKQGYVNITTEVVDLTDNSQLQLEVIQTVSPMKGNWKKGDNYENLKNSIEEAIANSITALKTKF